MIYKEKILNNLVTYLEKKYIKLDKRSKIIRLPCLMCNTNHFSANIIPNTSIVYCHNCRKKYNLIDIVRVLENKQNETEEEILDYLNKYLELNLITEKEINELLDFYEQNNFDLVPIAKNSKIPIEKEWTSKSHKDKKEWKYWLNQGLNIGVKTGKISNVTVIDFDGLNNSEKNEIRKNIASKERLKELIDKKEKNLKILLESIGNYRDATLISYNLGGFHLFFQYEEDLPKSSFNIGEGHIDIENDGGYILLPPSTLGKNDKRYFTSFIKIIKMPQELKEFLKEKLKYSIKKQDNNFNQFIDNIKKEDFKLSVISEGNRNNFFIHLGGILRKQLSLNQVEFVLNIVNKHFCNPPLPQKELYNNIIKMLDKYINFDEQELANKVLNYLRITDEATKSDIRQALDLRPTGTDKEKLDNVITYLTKENLIIKRGKGGGTYYHIVKKAEWKDTFINDIKEIDYKMPYFYDVATFRDSDMLILGGKPKVGKSHIALNIIKQLVQQGKKPYYVTLESGNRFINIALALGLKEGDFYWAIHFNPEQIELEKNAITIIDWIVPENYAETDKLFKYFAEQLIKKSGNLIIFVQLRESGKFFAKDMISFFPALVSRYLYDNEEDGTTGYFLCLDEDVEVYIKNGNSILPLKLKELYSLYINGFKEIEILSPYGFRKLKSIIETKPQKFYEIQVNHKLKFYASDNHLFPVHQKNSKSFSVKKVSNIDVSKEKDYFLFKPLSDYIQENLFVLNLDNKKIKLDYDLGYFIGAYLAEGWILTNRAYWRKQIGISQIKYKEKFLKYFKKIEEIFKVRVVYNKANTFVFNGERKNISNLYNFLSYFVEGKDCYSKNLKIKNILNTPIEFRKGIINGWLDGDGKYNGKYKEGITTSEKLAYSFYLLFSSLGIRASIKEYKYKNRNKIFIVHPFLDAKYNKRITIKNQNLNFDKQVNQYKGLKKLKIPIFNCLRIKPKIKKINNINKRFFDLQVEDELFIINGGIITHNCDYIREPKVAKKTVKIPCVYNFDTKELKRVDELENELQNR